MMKKRVSHILFLRKVAFRIPGSAEKGGGGAIRHAHPYYVISEPRHQISNDVVCATGIRAV